jgi:lactate permease
VDHRLHRDADLGHGWFKTWANSIFTWNYPVPELHNMINKVPPVAAKPTPEGAVFAFTYLSFTGTGMLIAAIISGFLMGFSPARMIAEYGRTIKLCAISLITISAMLAIGTLTRLSGVDATLGLAFAGDRRALSLLRHAARLAGRGADRIGYRLQRAVRQSAEDHLRAARPVADPDGRRQLLRRRDGQDDRRAVDRRRLHRDQLVRPRRLDPALRVLHSIVLACLVGVLVMLQAYVYPFTRAHRAGGHAGIDRGVIDNRHRRHSFAGLIRHQRRALRIVDSRFIRAAAAAWNRRRFRIRAAVSTGRA